MSGKISFVVTVYNKAAYLPLVLHALSQQEGSFAREFVFVNDGSTDNSLEILEAWRDKLPGEVIIIDQENQGPAIATNAGLRAVTGDYIKLVDGDDCLYPWATEGLLHFLDQEDCAFVISYNRQFIPAEDYSEATYERLLQKHRCDVTSIPARIDSDPLKGLIKQTNGNPTSWLAKREHFLKHGGCAEHIFVQDYILELGLAACGPMCVVDLPVFFAPETDPDRVSSNEEQTAHDMNLALAELIRREPEIILYHGKAALKRAYSRTWRFVKKQPAPLFEKVKYLSLYLGSKAGVIPVTEACIKESARPFREYAKLRHKFE